MDTENRAKARIGIKDSGPLEMFMEALWALAARAVKQLREEQSASNVRPGDSEKDGTAGETRGRQGRASKKLKGVFLPQKRFSISLRA
jgi:hypothetical protein